MKNFRLKFSTVAIFFMATHFLSAQTTVNLADQCNCEVFKSTAEVAAGATAPTGADTGDLLVDPSGDIFFWDGDSWEVPTAAQKAQPWFNVATNMEATDNNQDIYQLGNVGIGTTTPTEKLAVDGKIATTGALEVGQLGTGDRPSLIDFHAEDGADFNSRIYRFPGADGSLLIEQGTGSTGSIRFDTKNTAGDELIINGTTGNVGLGTTGPSSKLDVVGDARIRTIPAGADTDGIVTTDANGNIRQRTAAEIVAAGGGSGADGDAWGTTGEDQTSDIGRTGNVGIGTETPTQKLDVNGNVIISSEGATSANRLQLERRAADGTSNGISSIGTIQGTTNGLVLSGNGNAGDGTNDHLFIEQNSGKVGIGTTEPASTLEVIGGPAGAASGITVADNNTDNTDKRGYIKTPQYVNANPPVQMLNASNTAATNQLFVGGVNSNSQSSPTSITFRVDGDTDMTNSAAVSSVRAMHIEGVTGNVGIGTTVPATKLDVNGDARISNIPAGADTDGIVTTDANGNIRQRTAAEIVADGGGGADGDAWAVTGEDQASDIGRTGNVGIGTETPTQKLDVNGNVIISSEGATSANRLQLERRAADGTSNGISSIGTIQGTTNGLVLSGNGNAGDGTNDHLFIEQNSGKVGIGTTEPATTLEVIGGPAGAASGITIADNDTDNTDKFGFIKTPQHATANPPVQAIGIFNNTSTNQLLVGGVNSTTQSSPTAITFRVDGDTDMTNSAAVSSVRAMHIEGVTGNVGIGTTVPATKLDVNGDARISNIPAGATTDGIVTTDANGNIRQRTAAEIVADGGGGADGDAWAVTGEDQASDIGRTGNVGIGTTTPTEKLSVAGKIATTGALEVGQLGTGDRASLIDFHAEDGADFNSRIYRFPGANGSLLLEQGAGSTGSIRFDTKNTAGDELAINGTTGNVGIGTNTPESKLSISGGTSDNSISTATDNILLRLKNPQGGAAVQIMETGDFEYRLGINPTFSAFGGSGILSLQGINPDGAKDILSYDYVSKNILINPPNGTLANIGNVGIGTLIPNSLLDLGTSTGKKFALWDDGTTFYGNGISFDTYEFHAGATAEDPRMVIKAATGNVGIGTTDPFRNLDVVDGDGFSTIRSRGATGAAFTVKADDADQTVRSAIFPTFVGAGGSVGTYVMTAFNGTTGTEMLFYDFVNRNLQLAPQSSTSIANVGIGLNTPPTAKLDVNGDARIRTLPTIPNGQIVVADVDGNLGVAPTTVSSEVFFAQSNITGDIAGSDLTDANNATPVHVPFPNASVVLNNIGTFAGNTLTINVAGTYELAGSVSLRTETNSNTTCNATIEKSTDGGTTWTPVTTSRVIYPNGFIAYQTINIAGGVQDLAVGDQIRMIVTKPFGSDWGTTGSSPQIGTGLGMPFSRSLKVIKL